MNKLFCGGFRSGTFLLDAALIQNECEGRDRREERAEDLRNECVLGRQLAEGHEFFHRQNLAFNHAALDLDDVLVFLCELTDHASRSNGIVGGGSKEKTSGIGSDITITGGTVTATGGKYGAGIGGGGSRAYKGGDGSNITISGGTVTANGGQFGAGIGGGGPGYNANGGDGLGIAIISTSKGVMTDKQAREENVGGEVLCYVY